MSEAESYIFKAIMILVFMWINIRGVRDVGIITNILSIFVIVAFAMIAIIGFTHWGGNPFEPITAYPIEAGSDWIFYIGSGIAIGMWMYSGYESMSTIAGELEDPQVIPKATLITVPLIMATYILPTMAGLSAFKTEGDSFSFLNWGSEAADVGYASVATHFIGPAFGIFFGIVAIIAQCSIYNTYIASGSRGFFALADDNLAPKMLVKVDKKHGVPYISVISVAVVNLILCILPFKTVVVVDVFLLVSSYILVYISAMILRKRIPASDYKFKIPGGYGFLCVLCVVPMCIAFISFLINGSDYFIGGMIGIISGPILYYIWKRMYGGLAAKNPESSPVNPRTKLAVGDLNRVAIMFGILTVIGIAGSLFLPWYEVDWAFPDDYDMTLFSSQSAMFFGIKIATIVVGALTVLFAILGRTIDSAKSKAKAS
ncbi:MAG: APC family permease, partial [Clostridiales Family XIII bacterium]|jgi:amino acid transporter|nr:APC family permease [Clostridiales Family XIII bacterium]